MRSSRQHASGFTLIEIALALLVTTIGIAAVFSLFPQGSDSNRKAIQDTQIGLFSDYVLSGFRQKAQEVPWDSVVDSASFSISPLASIYAWKDPVPLTAGPGVKSVAYKAKKNPAIEEMAFRYEFRVKDVAGKPNVKAFILNVWPGEFGVLTATNVFYTEIYNFGANP